MKNLKKIFLFTLAAGLLYSCEDAYKIVQPGEYNYDIAFRTVDDMSLALVEVYDNISTEDIIAFTSVFTDEAAIGDENGGQNLDEYRFQLFATNDYAASFWVNNYAVINSCNRILENADNVVLDSLSDTFENDIIEKNRVITEARVLRAFSHFQLLNYFSEDMKNDAALGVIIADHVPPVPANTEQLPRSTTGEVFDFINADLDFAQLPENLNALTNNSAIFVTPRFVNGLRARIEAYRGHYPEAKTYAEAAIVGNTATGFGLVGPNVYQQIWSDTTLNEIIFGLERPNGKNGIVSNWFFNGASLDGGAFLDMSRTLFAELAESPNDVRYDAFVGPTSLIAENYETVFDYRDEDVIVIGKYPGRNDLNLPLNNRIKVMRIAEMYFIKAEAQAATGDLVGARATLQALRTKRTATVLPTGLTAQQTWKAILDERRIELCFEGHRYIDLKRLGTLAGVSGVDRYERDCAPFQSCELSITDHRFTLPIPIEEINGNRVIRSQQNPGY